MHPRDDSSSLNRSSTPAGSWNAARTARSPNRCACSTRGANTPATSRPIWPFVGTRSGSACSSSSGTRRSLMRSGSTTWRPNARRAFSRRTARRRCMSSSTSWETVSTSSAWLRDPTRLRQASVPRSPITANEAPCRQTARNRRRACRESGWVRSKDPIGGTSRNRGLPSRAKRPKGFRRSSRIGPCAAGMAASSRSWATKKW